MRVSDDRYSRDRRRMDIALRFIRHEARTHTIRLWTGLTDDRIRKLCRTYLLDACGGGPVRHRGKSPHQVGFFTRTIRARQEAALLASLCRMAGALPAPGAAAGPPLPGVVRGELLCQAYEAYRQLTAAPLIDFERAVFLVTALARADEVTLGGCRDCGGLVVHDRMTLRPVRCTHCASSA